PLALENAKGGRLRDAGTTRPSEGRWSRAEATGLRKHPSRQEVTGSALGRVALGLGRAESHSGVPIHTQDCTVSKRPQTQAQDRGREGDLERSEGACRQVVSYFEIPPSARFL